MKRREQASSRRQSVSESDAIVAKVVATSKELMEVARKCIAYRATHPIYLSVPDAPTEKEFLNKAKQVYRSAHIPNRKRGRRSEENVAMMRLMTLSEKLKRDSTNGEMIQALMDQQLMEQKVSKNTAGKYARLYRLWKRQAEGFSKGEQQWLHEKFGSESLSRQWWMDRWWRWFEELLRRRGVLDEIQNIFATGPFIVCPACEKSLRKDNAGSFQQ